MKPTILAVGISLGIVLTFALNILPPHIKTITNTITIVDEQQKCKDAGGTLGITSDYPTFEEYEVTQSMEKHYTISCTQPEKVLWNIQLTH